LKRAASVAALLLCLAPIFAQTPQEAQARLDGGYAAGAQYAIDREKSLAEQGAVSQQAYQQYAAKQGAYIAGLKHRWEGTKYAPQFEAGYRDIMARRHANDAPPPTATPPRQAPPAQPVPRRNPYDFGTLMQLIFGDNFFLVLTLAIMFGLGLFAVWAARVIASRQKPQEPSDTYGTASYADMALTVPNAMYLFQGVFFGKSSRPDAKKTPTAQNPGAPICSLPESHTLVLGRTRAGKGCRVAIPTLLRYYGGSVLTVDPKGENAAITARARSKLNTVHIVNPWGQLSAEFQKLGFPNATYNPLDILDRNDPNAVAVAQGLATAICPTKPGSKESFWQGSAASILTTVLLWIADQPGETKTLARAREIVTMTRKDFRDNFLVKMAASSAFSGAVREGAAPFIDLAQETYSGVMSNLAEATKFLSDPQVKASTATSSFDMMNLCGYKADKPVSVYLVIPPAQMDTQRTWLRLLITAGMHAFKKKPAGEGLRCMFLIDEFPALGRLDELPRDIATMAGYGVDFTLIAQGLDQIKAVYGDDAGAILNNCAYKWFCSVNDLQSAEYLSKTLGKATVGTQSQSIQQGGQSSQTFGETGRFLLNPDEVITLGRETAILLNPQGKPHYLRPVDYWTLPEAFASLKDVMPFLYWDPPMTYDANPYIKGSTAKP